MLRRRIESDEWRTRVLWALFLGVGTFFLAHAVNGVVAYSLVGPIDQVDMTIPAMPMEPSSPASPATRQKLVQDILSSGLFPLPPPPKDSASQGGGTISVAPPLNISAKLSLLGIIRGIQGDERAIIEEVSSKKQGLYQVSQLIPDVGQLVAIEKDRVLFREGAQEEWLDLAIVKQRAAMMPFPRIAGPTPDGAPIPSMPQHPPARRIIDRAQLTALAANPQTYLTEARFQPHFSGNGQIDGFQVDGIRQVGLLEKAGLQNGDVLAGVNGVEIRDPGKLWEIFKQLHQERIVRFNVVRNSQPMTLAVEIRG